MMMNRRPKNTLSVLHGQPCRWLSGVFIKGLGRAVIWSTLLGLTPWAVADPNDEVTVKSDLHQQILTALCGASQVSLDQYGDWHCPTRSLFAENNYPGEINISGVIPGAFSTPDAKEFLVILSDSAVGHADDGGGAALLQSGPGGLKVIGQWLGMVLDTDTCQRLSGRGRRSDGLVCENSHSVWGVASRSLIQIRFDNGQLEKHDLLWTQDTRDACLETVHQDQWDKEIATDALGKMTVMVHLQLQRGHRRLGNCEGKIRIDQQRLLKLRFLENDQGHLWPDPASAVILQKYNLRLKH